MRKPSLIVTLAGCFSSSCSKEGCKHQPWGRSNSAPQGSQGGNPSRAHCSPILAMMMPKPASSCYNSGKGRLCLMDQGPYPEALSGLLRVPHSQGPLPLLRLPPYCCKTPAMQVQAILMPVTTKWVLVRQVCFCLSHRSNASTVSDTTHSACQVHSSESLSLSIKYSCTVCPVVTIHVCVPHCIPAGRSPS